MGRPKKDTHRTHKEIHDKLEEHSFSAITSSCDENEMHMNLLISINGFLDHIDKCFSELADLELEREERFKSINTKGGNANAKSASRADDSREV